MRILYVKILCIALSMQALSDNSLNNYPALHRTKGPEKKSKLLKKKKQLEKKISYLQNRIADQEANGDEPAKLYEYLEQRKEIVQKLKSYAE